MAQENEIKDMDVKEARCRYALREASEEIESLDQHIRDYRGEEQASYHEKRLEKLLKQQKDLE